MNYLFGKNFRRFENQILLSTRPFHLDSTDLQRSRNNLGFHLAFRRVSTSIQSEIVQVGTYRPHNDNVYQTKTHEPIHVLQTHNLVGYAKNEETEFPPKT